MRAGLLRALGRQEALPASGWQQQGFLEGIDNTANCPSAPCRRLNHRRQRVHFVSLAEADAKRQRAQEAEAFKVQAQDSLHVI